MYYVHCENVGGVLVPRLYQPDAEFTPTDESPLPEKTSDMVTGLLEIGKHDCNWFFNCYTGTNADGSTDGIIEHKRYFHFDASGAIVAATYAMIDGIVQDVPAKVSDFITGALHTTNDTRVGSNYTGTKQDGSTDGTIA